MDYISYDEAISAISQEYNDVMSKYDRWISANPDKLVETNVDYREMKQMLKILRMRKNELIAKKDEYINTLRFTASEQVLTPIQFSKKPSDSIVLDDKKVMKIGQKRIIKVAQ